MEHEGVARLHLDVEQLEPGERRFEVFLVDDGLAVDPDVIEPAERVRSRNTCRQPFAACDGSSAIQTLIMSGARHLF